MLALCNQRAHRGCFKTIAQTHSIGRGIWNAEEIVGVLLHYGFFLRIVRRNLIRTRSGGIGGEESLPPILHLAFAVAKILHHQFLVDDGQTHKRGDER